LLAPKVRSLKSQERGKSRRLIDEEGAKVARSAFQQRLKIQRRSYAAKPGSADSLVLVVDDIDAARDDLIARGVDVSEVFHYAGGPFNNAVENPRVGGRDPQGRSYFSFASFEDPDWNGWLL
jgi:hypothetical protein